MNQPVDQRGVLDEDIFSYRITKDKRVLISWHGRHVTTLKGATAGRFISQIDAADRKQAQLLMARATGNFKHGNERNT